MRLASVAVALALVGCDGDSPDHVGSGAGASNAGGAASSGGSSGAPGGAGGAAAGTAGNTGGALGSGGAASGGSNVGGASGSGSAGVNGGFVRPELIGGVCVGTPVAPSAPCSGGSEGDQNYCSLSDPARVIMSVCLAAGAGQCEVMDECEPGWHACTATDYLARGGAEVAPDFSVTNHAWLAACVRDVTGVGLKDEPCSVCDQDPAYEPSIQWWCDGEVVYEGGMYGDTLGVYTNPDCMRVGENDAAHAAYWAMGFTSGAPSFVMCCLDNP